MNMRPKSSNQQWGQQSEFNRYNNSQYEMFKGKEGENQETCPHIASDPQLGQ